MQDCRAYLFAVTVLGVGNIVLARGDHLVDTRSVPLLVLGELAFADVSNLPLQKGRIFSRKKKRKGGTGKNNESQKPKGETGISRSVHTSSPFLPRSAYRRHIGRVLTCAQMGVSL